MSKRTNKQIQDGLRSVTNKALDVALNDGIPPDMVLAAWAREHGRGDAWELLKENKRLAEQVETLKSSLELFRVGSKSKLSDPMAELLKGFGKL